jgi:hypothetical protein
VVENLLSRKGKVRLETKRAPAVREPFSCEVSRLELGDLSRLWALLASLDFKLDAVALIEVLVAFA